jgi:hypothetical protein
MLTLDNAPRFIQYIAFAILFIMGQSAAMWGLYYTLPFKNLSMFQAYKMAIPFAWLDWVFMTLAINIGHKYNLVTPTQDTFVLIIVQFALILLINQYYLKQDIFRSDIIAFFLVLSGLFISFFHIASKIFGVPIHADIKLDESKVHAFTKTKAYRTIKNASTTGNINTTNTTNDVNTTAL